MLKCNELMYGFSSYLNLVGWLQILPPMSCLRIVSVIPRRFLLATRVSDLATHTGVVSGHHRLDVLEWCGTLFRRLPLMCTSLWKENNINLPYRFHKIHMEKCGPLLCKKIWPVNCAMSMTYLHSYWSFLCMHAHHAHVVNWSASRHESRKNPRQYQLLGNDRWPHQ